VASRRATLLRRGITEYVRPWVCGVLGVVTVAALASTVSFLVVLQDTDAAERRLLDVSGPATALLGTVAIFVAGVSTTSAVALARRPQPADALEREAAQHAIRSASMLSLLGGALLLVGTATVVAAAGVVQIDGDLAEPVRWAHGLLLYLGFGGAVTGFFLAVRAIPRFGRRHGRVAVAA
jgi:drug/metabolite transporter (DMT)-like permease